MFYKITRFLLIFSMFLSLFSSVPAFATPNNNQKMYVPGEVLVKFKEDINTTSINNVLEQEKNNPRLDKINGKSNIYRIKTDKDPVDYIKDLKSKYGNLIEYAEPNYIRTSFYTIPPNDPSYNNPATLTFTQKKLDGTTENVSYPYGYSWWERDMGIPSMWNNLNNTTFNPRATGSDIKVAVIDTGFYYNHPDASPNIISKYDFLESYTFATNTTITDNDTTPYTNGSSPSHGSCVAGQISAGTNNNVAIAGATYDNQVLVYKVQGYCTDDYPLWGFEAGDSIMLDSAIINSIYDATDSGAKIINLSLGGPNYSQALQDAVDYAWSHNVLVVAATGNDGTSNVYYPAACNHVVGVGSYRLDTSGEPVKSWFTNYGNGLDILAPGEAIYGLYNSDSYGFWSGTSMATPSFVSAAALLWRFAPEITNDELTEYLLLNAEAEGVQPNANYGYGYVNLLNAFNAIKTDYPYLSVLSISGTETEYINTNSKNISWNTISGTSVVYELDIIKNQNVSTLLEDDTISTSYILSSLTEARYDITVTPTSLYNWWTPTNSDTKTIIVDTTIPTVFDFQIDFDVITWNDSEGVNPHITEIDLDGNISSPYLEGTQFILPDGLANGQHSLKVRITDQAGNIGEWHEYLFMVENLLDPVLPDVSTNVLPYKYDWADVDYASGYQYKINGGDIKTTSISEITSSDFKPGENIIEVRAYNTNAYSSWITASIIYYPPLPGEIIFNSIDGDIQQLPYLISWNKVPAAEKYFYSILPSDFIGDSIGMPLSTAVYETEDPYFYLNDIIPGEYKITVWAENYSGSGQSSYILVNYIIPVNKRLSGDNRYTTSVAISKESYDTADTVVLATGENWPDALGAGVLAYQSHGPLLLTTSNILNTDTKNEIIRLNATKIYLVGGTGAISSTVENTLKSMGLTVERIAGVNRYETSARIAKKIQEIMPTAIDTAFIASGENFPDALSASPIAANMGYPILLTQSGTLPVSINNMISELGISNTIVVGGTSVISDTIRFSLPSSIRLAGINRYETAIAINEWALTNTSIKATNIAIANGNNFPDALSGGPLMADKSGILLLVPYDKNVTFVNFYNKYKSEIQNTYILGGSASVSPDLANWLILQ